MCFKNFEGKPEKESRKRTICASGGLGLLLLVLEPYTDDVSVRRLSPRTGGHEVMRQQGRWIRRGRFGGVPH